MIKTLFDCNWTRNQKHLILKQTQTLNHFTKMNRLLSCTVSALVSLTVCSHHVTYAFQSESTLYCFLNVCELLALLQAGAKSEV